ncbi:8-amino-7-oxononanoate synthase [Nitrosospira briensis]|uniref:8-amino-7-oxononanoate synthase n=1 Tax=Nitrosospira briensis TaxID=35799 RepID=A0A1I5DGU9_9PROT|nr:aminotransferase class I/II-fold pyridoxal phosphate-dependent enzyme [Nitrosospira briensis]SFN98494.1 8-amino-7-oxononanoate synthase [Nitrosospira briensis]
MLDFTSALYLGLHHPSRRLRPWEEFTMGRPAALAVPSDQERIARTLAELAGCERATLGSSTLHLFWDLFGMLSEGAAIYLDAGTYPIARWGVERAACRGLPVQVIAHYDADALSRVLKRSTQKRLRPVVVADGFCPGCGKPAPIDAYLNIIHERDGLLVLDDTQALGIFGHSQNAEMPLGHGGGGSLRLHNVSSPRVLLISSLAKAFGAPIAALCGSHAMVQAFEARSETRTHCSPPSIAAIHAAEHALMINRKHGDALRLRLAQLVSLVRTGLMKAGFSTQGGYFPVQTLRPLPSLDAPALHDSLLKSGVRTVLHQARNGHVAQVSFFITAQHAPHEIVRAVKAVRCTSAVQQLKRL